MPFSEILEYDHQCMLSEIENNKKNYSYMISEKTNNSFQYSNVILTSLYTMSINEMRLLLLCQSKAAAQNIDLEKGVKLYPSEFKKTFENKGNGWSFLMKQSVLDLSNRFVAIPYIASHKDKKSIVSGDQENEERLFVTRWLSAYDLPEKNENSYFVLYFTPQIVQLLQGLTGRYTKVEIENVKNIRNIFQFKLYLWLKSARYVFPSCYKYKEDGSWTLTISVDLLRSRLITTRETEECIKRIPNLTMEGVLKKQKPIDYKKIKRNTLLPALRNINESSDIEIGLTQIKKGRSVDSLVFHVKDKTNTSAIINGSLKKAPTRKLQRKPQLGKAESEANYKSRLRKWATTNIEILENHRIALLSAHPTKNLTKADKDKLVELRSYL